MGAGQVSIRMREGAEPGTRAAKPRLVFRNDVGKLLVNANLYEGMKAEVKKNFVTLLLFCSSEAVPSPSPLDSTSTGESRGTALSPTLFMLKLSSEQAAKELSHRILEAAPPVSAP
eukprot:SM000052S17684  [mRNA]  locus=s52:46742:47298:- [translate_table: standard]